MRRRLLAAVGAWAIGTGTGLAQPPAPPSAESLAARLGSDDFADREAAARALEARGEAALPALLAAASSDDPEVRRRAAALADKIKRTAESTRRLVPKAVALNYDRVPLGTALHDLKQKTGLNLALDPNRVSDPLRPITVRTGELPPWEAVEAFCRGAGLREAFSAEIDIKQPQRGRNYITPVATPSVGSVPVLLVDGKADPLPGDRSTAVRVLALPGSFPANRVVLGTGEVTLNFDITPLPALNWQEVVGVRVTRVVDDAGRPGSGGVARDAAPAGGPFDFPVFVNPRVAMRWDFDGNPIPPSWQANPRVVPVPLRVATPGARTLRRLEGVVVGEVTVPNQQLLVLDDPLRHPGTAAEAPGGLKLTVLEVKEPAADGSVVVKAQLESPTAFAVSRRAINPWGGPFWPEPPRDPSEGNRLQPLDAAGKPVSARSSVHTDVNELTLIQTYQFTFRAGAMPAKLAVVGPRTITVEVPFKLENVPLP